MDKFSQLTTNEIIDNLHVCERFREYLVRLPCDSSVFLPPKTAGSQCYHSPDSGRGHTEFSSDYIHKQATQMICIHEKTGRVFATNFIEMGEVCERLCSLYKRITAAIALNILRRYKLESFQRQLRADIVWRWADWFYLKFKWKQLLIVRDLLGPPPERLLQQKTDKWWSLTDTYWMLTYDTLSHVGGEKKGWSGKSANRRKQQRQEWNENWTGFTSWKLY